MISRIRYTINGSSIDPLTTASIDFYEPYDQDSKPGKSIRFSSRRIVLKDNFVSTNKYEVRCDPGAFYLGLNSLLNDCYYGIESSCGYLVETRIAYQPFSPLSLRFQYYFENKHPVLYLDAVIHRTDRENGAFKLELEGEIVEDALRAFREVVTTMNYQSLWTPVLVDQCEEVEKAHGTAVRPDTQTQDPERPA